MMPGMQVATKPQRHEEFIFLGSHEGTKVQRMQSAGDYHGLAAKVERLANNKTRRIHYLFVCAITAISN
jgi:hypothetical protein